ncbi:uncharacterized protein LOC143251698 [Tachypleus tridentatus]|uniref:uncharacterized protein LOC143251698 n=1 Tax=Tachypleus tridentatus TaxID=6853 RepID=UPI003FD0C897
MKSALWFVYRCVKTNIGSRISRTEELSDSERGTVLGCHLSNKKVRQISALLELSRSTEPIEGFDPAKFRKANRNKQVALNNAGRNVSQLSYDAFYLQRLALMSPDIDALRVEKQAEDPEVSHKPKPPSYDSVEQQLLFRIERDYTL